jgi:hypothetical protein
MLNATCHYVVSLLTALTEQLDSKLNLDFIQASATHRCPSVLLRRVATEHITFFAVHFLAVSVNNVTYSVL